MEMLKPLNSELLNGCGPGESTTHSDCIVVCGVEKRESGWIGVGVEASNNYLKVVCGSRIKGARKPQTQMGLTMGGLCEVHTVNLGFNGSS